MDYDVIIAGGRVAGSALAALLGGQGHRVLLLEKAHFPSDTLSTHFFRAPALRVFERLGVLDEVRSAAPPLTTVWNYMDGHVVSEPVRAPEDHLSYFLCERRITLDWILFQRVRREAKVEVRQGARVKELIWRDGRVVLRTVAKQLAAFSTVEKHSCFMNACLGHRSAKIDSMTVAAQVCDDASG